MKIVLITGISGYIGFHLAKKFYSEGYDVVGTYNSADSIKLGVLKSVLPNVTLIKADLTKCVPDLPEEVEHLDYVVHCAALKGIVDSNENPMRFYETNLTTTLNACKIADKVDVGMFVFVSTGIADKSECVYAKSKLMCEGMLRASGMKVSVLRYYNPIGSEHPLFIDKKNILNALYMCDKHNCTFSIFGEGVRDYIDIRDASEMAYEKIVGSSDALFNVEEIGIGKGVATTEFVKEYCSTTTREVNVAYLPCRENDVNVSVASYGCVPRYTLGETIKDYVKLMNDDLD